MDLKPRDRIIIIIIIIAHKNAIYSNTRNTRIMTMSPNRKDETHH